MLGRKRVMILVNIPLAIGWFILYQATQVWHIFVSISILGISRGLSEVSDFTYVGEIRLQDHSISVVFCTIPFIYKYLNEFVIRFFMFILLHAKVSLLYVLF